MDWEHVPRKKNGTKKSWLLIWS